MTRIVVMTFKEGKGDHFLEMFEGWREHIAAFPGCTSLRLVRDMNDPDIFMTISEWNGPADLENYRTSALFSKVWPVVKPLFREKALAWSVETLYSSGSAE